MFCVTVFVFVLNQLNGDGSVRHVQTLIQYTAFICWDHVLDVDKGIVSTISLKELERFLN
jgi:hypothetical protein